MLQVPMLSEPKLGATRPDSGALAGNRFEIALTRDPREIAMAQRLRYQVFYEEMSATPTPARSGNGYRPILGSITMQSGSAPMGS